MHLKCKVRRGRFIFIFNSLIGTLTFSTVSMIKFLLDINLIILRLLWILKPIVYLQQNLGKVICDVITKGINNLRQWVMYILS